MNSPLLFAQNLVETYLTKFKAVKDAEVALQNAKLEYEQNSKEMVSQLNKFVIPELKRLWKVEEWQTEPRSFLCWENKDKPNSIYLLLTYLDYDKVPGFIRNTKGGLCVANTISLYPKDLMHYEFPTEIQAIGSQLSLLG